MGDAIDDMLAHVPDIPSTHAEYDHRSRDTRNGTSELGVDNAEINEEDDVDSDAEVVDDGESNDLGATPRRSGLRPVSRVQYTYKVVPTGMSANSDRKIGKKYSQRIVISG